MNREKPVDVDAIASNLIENAEKISFGVATVSLKIHEGVIVAVSFESTEITRKKEVLK